jgi:hypothetical protein
MKRKQDAWNAPGLLDNWNGTGKLSQVWKNGWFLNDVTKTKANVRETLRDVGNRVGTL